MCRVIPCLGLGFWGVGVSAAALALLFSNGTNPGGYGGRGAAERARAMALASPQVLGPARAGEARIVDVAVI